MPSDSSAPAHSPALSCAVREAIAARYGDSGGARLGVTPEDFQRYVAAVVVRHATQASEAEQLELVASLRVPELVLARACSAGNDVAWEEFLTQFRARLYEAAYRIAHDEGTGRELADGLYAELYGIPNSQGRRVSKFDYYMGRGSLDGWLRTVLAQHYVDRYRHSAKEISLEQQIEAGVSFAAPIADDSPSDSRIAAAVASALAELQAEDRFLLASYYLDRRTLAEIGRQLHVHESTISRRLMRLSEQIRKRVRKKWQGAGLNARRCGELMQELDVRELNVDVAATLRQESHSAAFFRKDSSET